MRKAVPLEVYTSADSRTNLWRYKISIQFGLSYQFLCWPGWDFFHLVSDNLTCSIWFHLAPEKLRIQDQGRCGQRIWGHETSFELVSRCPLQNQNLNGEVRDCRYFAKSLECRFWARDRTSFCCLKHGRDLNIFCPEK